VHEKASESRFGTRLKISSPGLLVFGGEKKKRGEGRIKGRKKSKGNGETAFDPELCDLSRSLQERGRGGGKTGKVEKGKKGKRGGGRMQFDLVDDGARSLATVSLWGGKKGRGKGKKKKQTKNRYTMAPCARSAIAFSPFTPFEKKKKKRKKEKKEEKGKEKTGLVFPTLVVFVQISIVTEKRKRKRKKGGERGGRKEEAADGTAAWRRC